MEDYQMIEITDLQKELKNLLDLLSKELIRDLTDQILNLLQEDHIIIAIEALLRKVQVDLTTEAEVLQEAAVQVVVLQEEAEEIKEKNLTKYKGVMINFMHPFFIPYTLYYFVIPIIRFSLCVY